MSIVSVDNIQPIGSGTTVTVNKSVTLESGNTNITGVCTATSFSGSGANLTSLPSQVTISNNADNRVITGGSGVNLNGESTLTYDGSTLTVKGASNTTQAVFSGTGGSGSRGLEIVTETVGAADEGVILNARASGNTGRIKMQTNDVTAMTIDGSASNGNVTLNTGNLIIGTAGKGIDFSAQTTSSATGVVVQSEKITHFEEGIYVPYVQCSTSGSITLNTSYNKLSYTRINDTVTVHGRIRVSAVSSPSGSQLRVGLPFTSDVLVGYGDAGRVFGYARLENAAQHQYYYGIAATAGGNNYVQIHRIDENTDNTPNTCADVDSNARISVSFTFRAQ